MKGFYGQSLVLVRVKDGQGTWLGLKEACDKLLPDVKFPLFRHYLKKGNALLRPAAKSEILFMCLHKAVKTRSNATSLVHLEGVCMAAQKLIGQHQLVEAIASISDLPAHQPQPSASIAAQPRQQGQAVINSPSLPPQESVFPGRPVMGIQVQPSHGELLYSKTYTPSGRKSTEHA